MPMYNSNLGGEGNPDDDYCVDDELWNREKYTTDFLCADDETTGSCCLKRWHIEAANSTLYSGKDFSAVAFLNDTYRAFGAFQARVKKMHGDIHRFVGSIAGQTHFNPSVGEAVCDPVFPLFHSFLEYIRLLRTDCHQFDRIPSDGLDDCEPWCYEEIDTSLDFPMDFSCLCDNTDGELERYCSTNNVTARLMYDLSPNTRWNIVYELGSFWDENEKLSIECADYLNESWWALTPSDSEEEHETGDFNDDNEETAAFVSGTMMSRTQSQSELTVVSMVVMMAFLALIAMLKICGDWLRPKKSVDIKEQGAVYGATQDV